MPRRKPTPGDLMKAELCITYEKPGAPWKSEKPEEWEDKIYRGDSSILAHTHGKPCLPDYQRGVIPRGDEDEIDRVERFSEMFKQMEVK